MRTIDTVMVHCAASRGDVTAATIRKWHLERGWSDIGYHYVIRTSGQIELGRPLEKIGAHAKGHNRTSIGICLAGGYGGEFTYTPEQMRSLEILVHGLVRKFPIQNVCGHNDVTNKKTCPNFNVGDWYSLIRSGESDV